MRKSLGIFDTVFKYIKVAIWKKNTSNTLFRGRAKKNNIYKLLGDRFQPDLRRNFYLLQLSRDGMVYLIIVNVSLSVVSWLSQLLCRCVGGDLYISE